jgi:hypothetical protein
MAQKTPLPAKTVMYADRWNGTWFIEMENFRSQLMTDYHLRFLITGFLRLKRQWLFLLIVNKSNGFYFLKVATLNYSPSVRSLNKSFVDVDDKKILPRLVNETFKENALLQHPTLNYLRYRDYSKMLKKNSKSQLRTWHFLKSLSLIKDDYNYDLLLNRTKTYCDLKELRYKNRFYDSVKYLAPVLKDHLTVNPNFSCKVNTIKNYTPTLIWPTKLMQQRRYLATDSKTLGIMNNNGDLYTQLQYKPIMSNVYQGRSFIRKNSSIYQTLTQLAGYHYSRMYRYKRREKIRPAVKTLLKKYGYTLKFKHLRKRLATSVLFLGRAINRVAKLRLFFSYVPMEWSKRDYYPIKKFLVFERFGSQKYFVSSFSVLHLAMSRGSGVLLTDLLVRMLRKADKHTHFLNCVEKICRYFIADFTNNQPHRYSVCKGIEILFKGKLNGGDRAKAWRFKLGPVHSSTFYTNTREEHAKCMTRYGMFHIRVRLKLGLLSNNFI